MKFLELHARKAFSLVEVVLALGIVAFCLVILIALLPVGLTTVKESADEAIAANIFAAVESDLRNVPAGQTDSVIYGIPVWKDKPDATPKVFLDQNGHPMTETEDSSYALSWTIHRPAVNSREPLKIHLRLGWPSRAAAPTGAFEALVAIAEQES